MLTAARFFDLTRGELMARLEAGHPIDPATLDDTEYRGTSLGLPGPVEALTWKTFQKTFHRDPQTGALRGWNVRLEQTGLELPSVPLRDGRGVPRTFGHYEVVPARGHVMPRRCEAGLLIHYGRGGNSKLDPASRLRDPLVAVEPGRTDLLLGWSYLDLGWTQLGTPSFFVLEREGPLSRVVARPGGD